MTRLISRSAPASAAAHVVPHLCLFNTRPSVGQASFSSMVRRPAMYAIRKKGTHYHQGWVAKNPNISICFVKGMQRSNFATGPTALNPGLTKEDNNQHIQSSFSDLTNSSGNVDQTNQLSTSGFNDWESANARIRGSNPTDGSKQLTSYGKMNDITVSPRKSWLFQCSGNSKKSWVQRMDEWKNDVNFSKRNALLVESAIALPGAEDALSDTLKDLHSSENFILSTSNIDLVAPQESKTIFPDVERALSGTLKDPHSSDTSFLSTPNLNPVAPQAENEINAEITEQTSNVKEVDAHCEKIKKGLSKIYDKVLVVDDVTTAKQIVTILTTKYKDLIHACDTEVSKIDVKQETPVNHGEIICFSIYSGPQADFGNGKAYIWVDVLDGGHDVLIEFAPFFEDPTIKKVWHNYSFDSHIIGNCGIQVSGFHADTMHLARLWDSSRKIDGGYSLEALSNDPKVMSQIGFNEVNGKISMKAIFGRRKLKKDGSPGKSIMIDPVELLQRTERIPWISYSVLDSISTLRLYESLKAKLEAKKWNFDGRYTGSMYNFYEEYWRPFGSLLVKMEGEGLLVDRAYLSDVEKVAISEQQVAADRFRSWASKYCPDAKYMNVGSDLQIRQLFFGGTFNRKDDSQKLPNSNVFKVPNVENVIEDGKKKPSKYRNITLHNVITDGEEPLLKAEMYTDSGWPSTSGDALKILAGKILPDCIYPMNDGSKSEMEPKQKKLTNESGVSQVSKETSIYGTAFDAFGGGKEGKEACHAIAALCEVCSIDSLISNFILPLQGTHISGKDGRIHCSLNINTETGRLSARRPNLQNQPALEKDRYKIRQAFIAGPGKSLIVADYGQLELRILAHLANCKSMLDAFKAGGDFHSRTAMNMYAHVREAVENNTVLLEWHPSSGEEKPPAPLLKDAFAAERRKAKMLNFSIAYGKTPHGLSRDWKVSLKEARETVQLWYKERKEVLMWQQERKNDVTCSQCVHTLLGRTRHFPLLVNASYAYKNHVERAAINTPVQGSAADVAMCAMLEIDRNEQLRELGWKLLLQVHDEVILEGPTESSEVAKEIVIKCMEKPFSGRNILKVDLAVDAKCSQNWYAAK